MCLSRYTSSEGSVCSRGIIHLLTVSSALHAHFNKLELSVLFRCCSYRKIRHLSIYQVDLSQPKGCFSSPSSQLTFTFVLPWSLSRWPPTESSRGCCCQALTLCDCAGIPPRWKTSITPARRASFQPFWFLILLRRGCRIPVWSFDMFCSDSTKSRTDDFETAQWCIIHQRSLTHLCTWEQGAVPWLLVPALHSLLLAPSIIHPSILCQCSSLTLSFFQCFSYCPPSSISFIHGFYLFLSISIFTTAVHPVDMLAQMGPGNWSNISRCKQEMMEPSLKESV